MKATRKKLAPKPIYKSPGQMVLVGFEAPFEGRLNPKNPWVIMAHPIPWEPLCNTHDLNFQQNSTPVGAITENFISDLSFAFLKSESPQSKQKSISQAIKEIQESVRNNQSASFFNVFGPSYIGAKPGEYRQDQQDLSAQLMWSSGKSNYNMNKLVSQSSELLPSTFVPMQEAFKASSVNEYDEWDIQYDPNGNIKSLNRNGFAEEVAMDRLQYKYHTESNKLGGVTDHPDLSNNYNYDVDNQIDLQNYIYDKVGRIIGDVSTNQYYSYNLLGQISGVYSTLIDAKSRINPKVAYFYNERGYRIRKTIYLTSENTLSFFYVKGLKGTLLARYTKDDAIQNSETKIDLIPIYGMSRIGLSYLADGMVDHFEYEICDHLGNVRATIMKEIINNLTVATLTSYADYYPNGMKMPGRYLMGSNPYPYAYQGHYAELDEETGFNTFDLRSWDNRIGRWTSTDPMNFGSSPYVGMENNPLVYIDPTGGWPEWLEKMLYFFSSLFNFPNPPPPTDYFSQDYFNYVDGTWHLFGPEVTVNAGVGAVTNSQPSHGNLNFSGLSSSEMSDDGLANYSTADTEWFGPSLGGHKGGGGGHRGSTGGRRGRPAGQVSNVQYAGISLHEFIKIQASAALLAAEGYFFKEERKIINLLEHHDSKGRKLLKNNLLRVRGFGIAAGTMGVIFSVADAMEKNTTGAWSMAGIDAAVAIVGVFFPVVGLSYGIARFAFATTGNDPANWF